MLEAQLLMEAALAAGTLLAGMAVAQGMPEGYKPPIKDVDWEGYKARVRAENNVRLIKEEEAGVPAKDVPNGIYGHSFSVSFDNPVPLFQKTAFQCFELHKTANGELVILGCVEEKAAELLKSGEFAAFRLYPEPYDNAVVPISLNFAHIIRSNNRMSRANGNYIEFDAKIPG